MSDYGLPDPNGFVLLWRKALRSVVWQNPTLWRFWTWSLMKASHQKRIAAVGYQRVELKPGQFITGRKVASRETGLTQQQIRTCLKILKKHKKITIKTTSHYSIITILNWGIYQSPPKSNNHQNNQPVTSHSPATNHRQLIKQLNNQNNSSGPVDLNHFKQAASIYENHSVKACYEFCQDKNIDFSQVEDKCVLKHSRKS